MENRINIAEILKNCPEGTKLYSPVFGECKFVEVFGGIKVTDKANDSRHFYQDGRYHELGDCVLFPSKDQRDWNKFQIPFKEGDIILWRDEDHVDWIGIYKHEVDGKIIIYPSLSMNNMKFLMYGYQLTAYDASRCRFARSNESDLLFRIMEENGYRWNSDTKTLEKLVKPKFKVGDQVIKMEGICTPILITKVGEEFYFSNNEDSVGVFSIKDQDNWELVSNGIRPEFKVGDRIEKCGYKHIISEIKDTHYILDDGSALPFEFQDEYELSPNKFDISTLVPFESRVLVRDCKTNIWKPAVFGGYISDYCEQYKYAVIGGNFYKYLIPYEGNEHLRCKTDDCNDYYKTWK